MKQTFTYSAVIFCLLLFLASCRSKNNENKSTTKPQIEWIDIQAGSFMMGMPDSLYGISDSLIQHEVELNAFKISKYEITFEQYDIFCEATARAKPDDNGWGRGKRPVINVSWEDAHAFADWMGCRLPTEAEWEYACRAGTTTLFNTGDTINTTQANFICDFPSNGKLSDRTKIVGSYVANAWGLFDMHGNVWEWCSDWYGPYLKGKDINPRGPYEGKYKVLRGGSWSCSASQCRSGMHERCNPLAGSNEVGFRLVMDVVK